MAYVKKEIREYIEDTMPVIDYMQLPDDFEKFCLKCFEGTYRLFYKKNKKYYTCTCEYCEHKFRTTKLKEHRVCPNCGMKLKIVKDDEDVRQREYWEDIGIIQELNEEQFVLRKIYVERQRSAIVRWNEYERVIFNKDFTKEKYYKKLYRYAWGLESIEWRPGRVSPNSECKIYPSNIEYLTTSNFKYSCFREMCQKLKLSPIYFKIAYERFPQLEYLWKVGMTNMIIDIVRDPYRNFYGLFEKQHELHSFFGLSKEQFAFAQKVNARYDVLEVIRFLTKAGLPLTKRNLRGIRLMLFKYVINNVDAKFSEIEKYMSIKSFYEYAISQNCGAFFISDYYDYLENCKMLKRDLNNTKWLKPKNFKLAHDISSAYVRSRKNKKLDSEVKEVLKEYQCLSFKENVYCVVVPKTARDIRLEGANQSNCVAGYVDRVNSKSSIICFIRHAAEPNKSFYTLELDPKSLRIVQCRGYRNNPTEEDPQVQAFARKWQKEVVLKKLKKVV